MTDPKYMTQDDWVTYDTKELGRVRMFRALSNDSAQHLAHRLNLCGELLNMLQRLLSEVRMTEHMETAIAKLTIEHAEQVITKAKGN
jgi:hypothetical protein